MGTESWNEVIQQAQDVMDAAGQALGGEDPRLCQERGENLELDELCERYAEGGGEKLA